MVNQIQYLLSLFGIPFLTAEGEADSQCVFLEKAGLVDGIISNDNDLLLFGAQNMYKDVFNNKSDPMLFSSNLIESELGLTQADLILLSYLLGSDYTDGVKGIGVVTACEILVAFHKKDTTKDKQSIELLQSFVDWMKEEEKEKGENNRFKNVNKSIIEALSKLKKKKIDFDSSFPTSKIFDYYTNLEVSTDTSREPFSWGVPNMERLTEFTLKTFGWNKQKSDQTLGLALNRYNSLFQKQQSLDQFFHNIPKVDNNFNLGKGKIAKVVKLLKQRYDPSLGENEEEEEEEEEEEKKPKRVYQKRKKQEKNEDEEIEIDDEKSKSKKQIKKSTNKKKKVEKEEDQSDNKDLNSKKKKTLPKKTISSPITSKRSHPKKRKINEVINEIDGEIDNNDDDDNDDDFNLKSTKGKKVSPEKTKKNSKPRSKKMKHAKA